MGCEFVTDFDGEREIWKYHNNPGVVLAREYSSADEWILKISM